jgi:hypothetical protein
MKMILCLQKEAAHRAHVFTTVRNATLEFVYCCEIGVFFFSLTICAVQVSDITAMEAGDMISFAKQTKRYF